MTTRLHKTVDDPISRSPPHRQNQITIENVFCLHCKSRSISKTTRFRFVSFHFDIYFHFHVHFLQSKIMFIYFKVNFYHQSIYYVHRHILFCCFAVVLFWSQESIIPSRLLRRARLNDVRVIHASSCTPNAINFITEIK